jgi:hypothetical protein
MAIRVAACVPSWLVPYGAYWSFRGARRYEYCQKSASEHGVKIDEMFWT